MKILAMILASFFSLIGCQFSKIDLPLQGHFDIARYRISIYKWDPGAIGGTAVDLACVDSNSTPKWKNRFLILNRDSDVKISIKGDTLMIYTFTREYDLIAPIACGYHVKVRSIDSDWDWAKIKSVEFHESSKK